MTKKIPPAVASKLGLYVYDWNHDRRGFGAYIMLSGLC
jgi:hypothetical protein